MNAVLEGRLRSATSPRARAIIYWTATALVAAEFVTGGVTDVLHLPPFFATLLQLGYPAYFGVILGVWKLLGTLVVLAPGLARPKEWAYAGMVFDLTGAVASAVATGQYGSAPAAALAFTGLVVVSWALRPASRRLP